MSIIVRTGMYYTTLIDHIQHTLNFAMCAYIYDVHTVRICIAWYTYTTTLHSNWHGIKKEHPSIVSCSFAYCHAEGLSHDNVTIYISS